MASTLFHSHASRVSKEHRAHPSTVRQVETSIATRFIAAGGVQEEHHGGADHAASNFAGDSDSDRDAIARRGATARMRTADRC
jgi:hypothetical protein